MRVFRTAAAVMLAALSLSGCGAYAAVMGHSDPSQVQIVTSDIPRFWKAYDDAARSSDPASVYDTEYFKPGTAGVAGFTPHRLRSPQHLADVVAKFRRYYAATRPYMAQIRTEKPRIMRDLYRYKKFYPQARFPDVYVVVGAMNSAGTSVGGVGLVLGAEMLSRPPDAAKLLPADYAAVVTPAAHVPAMIAHEFTHFNQSDANANDLLGASVVEGSADFMAEHVDANAMTPAQWAFGCAHEDALWKQFQAQMHSQDEKVIDNWLYSYDPGPLGAPPFIGYWMGSRITQTYYQTHGRNAQAISDIMHVKDYDAFLQASGYPEKRPACRARGRSIPHDDMVSAKRRVAR